MYVPFNELNEKARVWIYQSDRKLSDEECDFIDREGKKFSEEWTAHNQALRASIRVSHAQFIIISVDETQTMASGCSIDKSVHFIQNLEKQLSVNLLDKSKVALLINDEVVLTPLGNIKKKIADGDIQENSLVFNNLVENIQSLNDNWVIPAKSSWMNRFF
ncbi:hypothetical protein C9994_05840 [Marivirga lumbricoides]|uniref:ABC transporter ATPase n=1 Tax=Marivirga lumbricoides TaxID=1046115 RepID=A0A2T4DSP6_9BACT|nr:hypothetical protein C9994_05840 [Marivirga lumbricoides]